MTGSSRRKRQSVRITITKQPAESDSAVAIVEDIGSTYQLVEYASPVVRELINSLPEGSVVDVDIERVLARGNCWRVIGVHAVADETATL
ncbi:hypothetical protein [Haloarcula montana]|uniref:hypothetical protein n=1 Tax=Haloarcula montana TaxID=3111776 RepID=UPI002D788F34|nr:hypothetical protein [Haloarcula sp. GH36]